MDLKKQHMNYGVWRKDCHRQINRKSPYRDRSKEHEYAESCVTHINYVGTRMRSTVEQEKFLEANVHILRLKEDQEDYVSGISLTEKHILENKINKLHEALMPEQEKKRRWTMILMRLTRRFVC